MLLATLSPRMARIWHTSFTMLLILFFSICCAQKNLDGSCFRPLRTPRKKRSWVKPATRRDSKYFSISLNRLSLPCMRSISRIGIRLGDRLTYRIPPSWFLESPILDPNLGQYAKALLPLILSKLNCNPYSCHNSVIREPMAKLATNANLPRKLSELLLLQNSESNIRCRSLQIRMLCGFVIEWLLFRKSIIEHAY